MTKARIATIAKKPTPAAADAERLRFNDPSYVASYVDDSTHSMVRTVTYCALWKVDKRPVCPKVSLSTTKSKANVVPERYLLWWKTSGLLEPGRRHCHAWGRRPILDLKSLPSSGSCLPSR